MPLPIGSFPDVVIGPGTPGTQIHDGILILGDVALGTTDESGTEWILESLTGWFEPASSTGAVEQRSADHGGWAGPAYYAPRTLALTGSILATDWAACSEALDVLMGSVPLDEPDWLIVDEGSRTLRALVRQDGGPLVERRGGWARFSLSLVAPDPRRYGDEVIASTGLPLTSGGLSVPMSVPISVAATTTSGLLTVTNEGNMGSRPVLAVVGPCPVFTITQTTTGRRLSSLEAVDAGRILYLDADKRLGLLDGTALRVITGTWFDIEPGANNIQFSSASYDASASLTVSFRSAWR